MTREKKQFLYQQEGTRIFSQINLYIYYGLATILVLIVTITRVLKETYDNIGKIMHKNIKFFGDIIKLRIPDCSHYLFRFRSDV
jgi:hypothetical protein